MDGDRYRAKLSRGILFCEDIKLDFSLLLDRAIFCIYHEVPLEAIILNNSHVVAFCDCPLSL